MRVAMVSPSSVIVALVICVGVIGHRQGLGLLIAAIGACLSALGLRPRAPDCSGGLVGACPRGAAVGSRPAAARRDRAAALGLSSRSPPRRLRSSAISA